MNWLRLRHEDKVAMGYVAAKEDLLRAEAEVEDYTLGLLYAQSKVEILKKRVARLLAEHERTRE